MFQAGITSLCTGESCEDHGLVAIQCLLSVHQDAKGDCRGVEAELVALRQLLLVALMGFDDLLQLRMAHVTKQPESFGSLTIGWKVGLYDNWPPASPSCGLPVRADALRHDSVTTQKKSKEMQCYWLRTLH